MKITYVYILKCSDGSYYTGMTNNLDKRIIEHNEGYDIGCYTFTRRPVELIYYQACYRPIEAIILEKKIKGWSRAKKEAFIAENWDRLKELSVCKNPSSHFNFKKE
jgi:putative endonuclease